MLTSDAGEIVLGHECRPIPVVKILGGIRAIVDVELTARAIPGATSRAVFHKFML